MRNSPILDVLLAHLVLHWQFMAEGAGIAAIAVALGIEAAQMRLVALVLTDA